MKEEFVRQMIADYDQLIKVSRESYDLVIPTLTLVHKQRGEIIKSAGEVDFLSRYICRGFIGYYNYTNDKESLFAIYQSSDTVFDLDSYRTGKPSQNELRAISNVSFLEFPIAAENDVTARDPDLLKLALLVNQRITNRQSRVHEISKMDPKVGYRALLEEFKGIGVELSNSELASFFHVSIRTINRRKSRLD